MRANHGKRIGVSVNSIYSILIVRSQLNPSEQSLQDEALRTNISPARRFGRARAVRIRLCIEVIANSSGHLAAKDREK
jgi:hypothetical protein